MVSENNETSQPKEPQIETPETPEAEQEQQEGQETPEPEASPDETEEEAPEGEEAKPEEEADPAAAKEKHARSGGYKRKIERLEREREILMEQLASQRGQPQQPPPGPAHEQSPEEKAAEFVQAMVQRQLAQERAREQQHTVMAQFQERTQAARAELPDFDEVLQEASHLQVPAAVQQVLLTSTVGPKIMYQLAKNPAELARISALPPLDAAREIGRLEAKASGAAPQKTKSAARPPPPPSTVGGSAKSANFDGLDLASYKKAMRSRGK